VPDIIKPDSRCANCKDNVEYYYLIYGEIPETGPVLSCRRLGRTQQTRQYKRKQVKCPHCGEKLTFTDADTKVELFNKPYLLPTPCQLYLECQKCKNETGVSVVIQL